MGASAASLVARSARRASASQSGAMAMGRCTMSCDMPRSSSETRAHRMYCCGMHTMWSRASSRFSTRAGLSPRGVDADDGTPLYIYIHPPIHHPSICPHAHAHVHVHVHVHAHVHVPMPSRALACHVAVKEHAAQLRQHATLHAPCDEPHAGRRRRQGLRRGLRIGAAPREREGEGRQLTPLRRA